MQTSREPEMSLPKKIARLETMNDYLESEIAQLDQLLRTLGFAEGLVTLKAAAREIIDLA